MSAILAGMHIAEIEFELKDLVKQKFDAESFIFRFLEIFL